MAYVKISDPAIMDLSGIQQIINVVNQHSDYLNALVNRFGANYVPDWTQPNVQANFDIATSNIVYGKVTITPDDDATVPTSGRIYYSKNVTFDTGISFSEIPNVIITNNNIDNEIYGNVDIVASIHNCSTTGFTIRIYRAGIKQGTQAQKDSITTNVELNFIAVGRR